ncbi:MAG: 4a-hydroxytetrahydrobiopterin dehydratase [Alphaproteobacteria bacterium]
MPLKQHEIAALMPQLADGWRVVDAHHLEKEYAFKDFREGLDFVNKVGELAERQSHHPDLYLAWGKAKVTLWTHKIDGLAESDFVMAAKIDEIHG